LSQTSHRWIIQGAGSSTIIDASQLQDRVFQIVNPGTQVVFQDLVIQGGLAQDDGTPGARPGTTDALGGGVFNNGGDVTLNDVVLQNNVAHGGDDRGYNARGGGVYSTGGALTIAGASFTNNQAIGGDALPSGYHDGGSGSGGGLYASGGSSDISDSWISSNRASGGRGGDGTGCSSSNCGYGGNALGGGLYVNGGSLTLASSTIDSNQGVGGLGRFTNGGDAEGSGIYNYLGTLTVGNCTLSGNSGNIGNSVLVLGAGICNVAGMLTVADSTFSGNSADFGGGIYSDSGTLSVSNSTLYANAANGGGIFIGYYVHPITLTNVTITANRGNLGGGLDVFPGAFAPVLHSTLIAGNLHGATADDVNGRLDSSGDYNLIGDGTGMTGLSNGVNGNEVGSLSAPIDPLLGPLQENGGPTQTRALLPGSPALNAGAPGQLGVPDQRGVVRKGGVNIGAYQASASAFLLDAPTTVTAGVPFDVTVTAVDPFGQMAVGYTGTVTFSTTDPDSGVVLPADYTFTADDGGIHTFSNTGLGEITLVTPGNQVLTVSDTADSGVAGSATITVVAGGGPSAGAHSAHRHSTPLPAGTGGAPERSFTALAADLWAVLARRQHDTAPAESAARMTDLLWEEDRLFG
jgi:predicted outer membrane repeat protein